MTLHIIEDISDILSELSLIEAFAVGGSHARGIADEKSDYDFFILLKESPSKQFFDDFRCKVYRSYCVLAHSPTLTFIGFGLRESFILDGGKIHEYFFNTRESLTFDPIRKGTKVIWDTTGFYSEFCQKINNYEYTKTSLTEIEFAFLNNLSKTEKYAHRKEALPLIERIHSLRQVWLALIKSTHNNQPPTLHGSDRGELESLSRLYGFEINNTLVKTVNICTLSHIACQIVDLITDQLLLRQNQLTNPKQLFETVSKIRESIYCVANNK